MRVILGICFVVLFLACKKEKEHTPYKPLDFTLAGLPDTVIRMEQVDTLEIPLSVYYISGAREKVVLQISGLPLSMGAGFSTSVDTPAFQSVLRLVSHHTDTGTYNIVITVSDSKQTKTYSFKVSVQPNPVNPALMLVGKYAETGNCTISGNINDTVNITEVGPQFNKLKLVSLWNGNPSTILLADIDPVLQTIVIPAQIVNNATFYGSGSYSMSQIHIKYKVETAFTNDSCSVILSRL